MKKNDRHNKYLIFISILFIISFLLTVNCGYSISNQIDLTNRESSFNYIIVDDLWAFISAPYKNILSYHSAYVWTLPTIVFFAFDNELTNLYLNNIEPNVRYGVKEGYIYPLYDYMIFSSLKSVHILNSTYLNDNKLYRFTYSVSEAIVDSYFIAQGIKMITGRARPVLSNRDPYSWFNPSLDPLGTNTSFPSLHATYFFAVSTIIGKYLDNEIFGDVIGIVAFLSIPGANHWLTDIWIGYLLGKSIGYYVWHKNKNTDLRDKWWVHLEFRSNVVGPHPSLCFLKVF